MNLDVAKGMLKPYGMTVDCVDSGQKAIDIIKEGKTKYSAIFMDHMMPEMDGFAATAKIREWEESQRKEKTQEFPSGVPIIALTANAILGNEELFLNSGFQAFLSKPIDIMRLDMIVSRYIRNRKLEQELVAAGKMPTKFPAGEQKQKSPTNFLAGAAVEGIDFGAGLKRFENSEEIYLGILKSYYSQLPVLLEKLKSFTAAALDAYKIAAHSLKSTSYTVGAKKMGNMAESLEKAASEGNAEYVKSHNAAAVGTIEKLIPALGNFLERIKKAEQKPSRGEPDPAILARLLKACIDYDMEGMDTAIGELEQFRYESQADLVEWLRKTINKSEFEEIRKHLESLNIKSE
jgi:CheY-like chemotaxis protein